LEGCYTDDDDDGDDGGGGMASSLAFKEDFKKLHFQKFITCSLKQFVKEFSQEESRGFILQQKWPLPHFHHEVHRFLN
jgi:hypothetical protein